MSIIKCPICRGQVSTMAGTCPHCGIRIAGHLQACPCCGNYCLTSQEECPECKSPLTDVPAKGEAPLPPGEQEVVLTADNRQGQDAMRGESIPQGTASNKPVRKKGLMKRFWKWGVCVIILILICVGGYFFHTKRMEQKEQADYERLEGKTNPDFYQRFLNDYPNSKHYDEIRERMATLQAEVDDWRMLQGNISRQSIALFMHKHPNSLRQRACEDMLDSIDWQDAAAIGSEEAITDYLHHHPSGRYVSDAADKKNALLLTRVTHEERAMIRGTLEAFFTRAIGERDMEAAQDAIPGSMIEFCGTEDAVAEDIIEYAEEKMADDITGLHYSIGRQMSVRKETLPDGNTGFAVEATLHETISRDDIFLPTSNQYRVNALLNHNRKIVKMDINMVRNYESE